jgi:predicted nucleic acid-binding protein
VKRVKRVVFDTSTLIGAALHPESTPKRALTHAFVHWHVCASAETLAELETVLEPPSSIGISTRDRAKNLFR